MIIGLKDANVKMQKKQLHGQVTWRHIWRSTVEKNICNQCDFACSDPSSLRTHLKTHSGDKLNKCNQCDYRSSRASNLRTHLKTHSGEKSNKCNERNGMHIIWKYTCYAMHVESKLWMLNLDVLNKCNIHTFSWNLSELYGISWFFK